MKDVMHVLWRPSLIYIVIEYKNLSSETFAENCGETKNRPT